jgi:hypothetical protein
MAPTHKTYNQKYELTNRQKLVNKYRTTINVQTRIIDDELLRIKSFLEAIDYNISNIKLHKICLVSLGKNDLQKLKHRDLLFWYYKSKELISHQKNYIFSLEEKINRIKEI